MKIDTLKYILLIGLLSLVQNTPSYAQQDAAVTFQYDQFPPYTYVENGQMKGTDTQIIEALAKNAGLKINWELSNFTRMIQRLDSDVAPYCLPGYKFTEDRARRGKYSLSITKADALTIATLEKHAAHIKSFETVQDFLKETPLIGGYSSHVDYMENFDEIIKEGVHLNLNVEDNALMLLVDRERIDFFFTSKKVVDYNNSTSKFDHEIIGVDLKGFHEAEDIYILCSKNTPDAVIEKFNKAIRETH